MDSSVYFMSAPGMNERLRSSLLHDVCQNVRPVSDELVLASAGRALALVGAALVRTFAAHVVLLDRAGRERTDLRRFVFRLRLHLRPLFRPFFRDDAAVRHLLLLLALSIWHGFSREYQRS